MEKYQELTSSWLMKLGAAVGIMVVLTAIILLADQLIINKYQHLVNSAPVKTQAATELHNDLIELQQLLNESPVELDALQGFLANHWPSHKKAMLLLTDELLSTPSLKQFKKDYTRLLRALKEPDITISRAQLSELTHLVNTQVSRDELLQLLLTNQTNNHNSVQTSLNIIKFCVIVLLLSLLLVSWYFWLKIKKLGKVNDRNRKLALYARRNSRPLLRLTPKGKLNYYNDKVYQLGQRYGISRYDLIPEDIVDRIHLLIREHTQEGIRFDMAVGQCRFMAQLDWIKEIEQAYLTLELISVNEEDTQATQQKLA